MADALQITDFETTTINSAADKIDENTAVNGLPNTKFLSFYKAIIENLKKYQAAFEEKNFNQLARFDIEISKLIADYFKKSSDADRINSFISAATEEAVKQLNSLISKNVSDKSKTKTDEEIKDAIAEAIESHKKKITDKIKEELGTNTALKSGSKKKTEAEKTEDAAVAGTVAAVNVFLKKQDNWYTKRVSAFVTEVTEKLMRIMRASTKNVLDPTKNAKFLRNKHKALGGPEELIDEDFVNAGDIFGKESIWKQMADKLKIFNKLNLGKKLKLLTITMPKRFAKFLGKYLVGLSIVLIGAVIHGVKILKNVFVIAKNVLTLGYKILMTPLKLAYNIGAFAVKTTANVFKGIFSISKKIFVGLSKNPISKTIVGALIGFFSTYTGAYALGQMFGYIWYGIKKKLGLEDENGKTTLVTKVENGLFSIKHSLLEAMTKAEEALQKIPKLKDIQKKFLQSKTYSALKIIAKAAQWIVKNTYTILVPAISALGSLLGIFAGKDLLRLFGIYRKAKVGSLIGLYQLQRTAGRIIFKGGIAGLIAGAAVIGSAYAFSKLRKKKKTTNEDILKTYSADGFQLDLDEINKGGIIHPEQVIKSISNNNKKWQPLARDLTNLANDIEDDFNAYNDEIALIQSLFGQSSDKNILPAHLPIELIKQILTLNGVSLCRQTDLDKISEMDFYSQANLCKSVLEFKIKWINARIAAFRDLSKSEYASDLEDAFLEVNLNAFSEISELASHMKTSVAETTATKESFADIVKELETSSNEELEKFVSSTLSTGNYSPQTKLLQLHTVRDGIRYYSADDLLGLSLRTKYLLADKYPQLFAPEIRKKIIADYNSAMKRKNEVQTSLQSNAGYLTEQIGDIGSNKIFDELLFSNQVIGRFYKVVRGILNVLERSFISDYLYPFRDTHNIDYKTIEDFQKFFSDTLTDSLSNDFLKNKDGYVNLQESSMFIQKSKEVAENVFVETIEKVKAKYKEEPMSLLFDERFEDITKLVKTMMENKEKDINDAITSINDQLEELEDGVAEIKKATEAKKGKETQQ